MEKASAIVGPELRCSSAKLGELGLGEVRRVSANSILDSNVHCQLWIKQGTKILKGCQMSLYLSQSFFLVFLVNLQ